MDKIAALLALIFLTGCVTLDDYTHYLRGYNLPPPTLESFPHCYDYGCKTVKLVSLDESDWQVIQETFTPASKNATQERERISKAIGLFEQAAGQITGTKADIHGTFLLYAEDNAPNKFQQDCVDESTNTTIYLALLQQEGLLPFHRVVQPEVRMPILSGGRWWHQTAVIEEIESGEKFAVDSWFENNGKPAYVVPRGDWMDGWKPAKSGEMGRSDPKNRGNGRP